MLPLAFLLISELTALNSVISLVLLQLAIMTIVWQGQRDRSLSLMNMQHPLIAVVVGGTLLYMALALSGQFQTTHDLVLVRLILALFSAGLGLLVGSFPFQLWLLPLCRDLSWARLLMVTALLRPLGSALLVCVIVSAPWLLSDDRSSSMLVVAGSCAALACAALSLAQTDLVDRLVYVATADLGFVLVGAFSGTRIGLLAALLVIVNHAISMVLLVGGLALADQTRSSGLKMVRALPIASMLIGALALIGSPPTSGFPGRLAIYQATWDKNTFVVVLLTVATALMTLSLLHGGLAYARARTKPSSNVTTCRVPRLPFAGLAVVMAVVLGIGLHPDPLMQLFNTGLSLGNLP
jgi:NADH-quinone oxidoreductase subunit M